MIESDQQIFAAPPGAAYALAAQAFGKSLGERPTQADVAKCDAGNHLSFQMWGHAPAGYFNFR